ncbi:hypothetical protein DSO57_1039345 [Entomophthora muscae]|uniref:Uncharacterized protein n=1 Tax=Entomophthora muscae TaxID=34485 RepID=A0ACC2SBG6_9FUNG|nr:hypothetical protein DSO57_1039345 [Entomophthora muscae]
MPHSHLEFSWPRYPVADNNSSSSRASSPEPELEAHKQVSVLHRPASQQLTAPQSQRLHMSQCTPSPNLRVQQRSSDNETFLPSSSLRRTNNPNCG